jgi:hypothetical protein
VFHMSLFALPLVGRAGLGNGLFPWARAELFAHQCGAHVLAPHWAKVRLGPYLRGEPEKRNYGRFFQAAHHVHGLPRIVISALGRRISEGRATAPAGPNQSFLPQVVEFNGIGDLFTPLLAEHEFVGRQLWGMTREPLLSTGQQYGNRFIAMHVRRGDITRQGFAEQELKEVVRQFTPLSWFIGMARAVRRVRALRSVRIVVFTDGGNEEVEALCNIDGTYLSQRLPSITELWTMAHAGLLFASGFSTFSMWASFLGGMPTVYAPGKIQQRVQAGRAGPVEIELPAGSEIPECALARLYQDEEAADFVARCTR